MQEVGDDPSRWRRRRLTTKRDGIYAVSFLCQQFARSDDPPRAPCRSVPTNNEALALPPNA